jgi:formiminotetrahydrofolate cyclodeaminase
VSDERTAAFLQVLDPADNSTGGGTASAIAGAMAAALVAMVARLSSDRASGEPGEYYAEIASEGGALAVELRAGGDEDARAFGAVMAAYRLPKRSDEERAARSGAIRTAMAHATRVPLRNAELCAAVADLVARLEGRANPRALSDLQSAAYLAEAGLQGCLANVDINLPAMKDEAAAADIRARVDVLRARLPFTPASSISAGS